MYKAFPYEKTSVRTKLYKCFYVFISYRERISFISDAAPRRLTSKCACGRVLFKSQLLTLGYFCFGYRPVGSYIFFGNRSQKTRNPLRDNGLRVFAAHFCARCPPVASTRSDPFRKALRTERGKGSGPAAFCQKGHFSAVWPAGSIYKLFQV